MGTFLIIECLGQHVPMGILPVLVTACMALPSVRT